MRLEDISKLLAKVDPGKIQALFPSKADQERFEGAKSLVTGILESLQRGPLDATKLEQVETAAAAFRELYGRLSPKTEVASKAALNEAVLRAEVGNLERSIFLAGIAKEKRVQEPYRSQLNSLPTHACCSRYRQIATLSDSVKKKLDPLEFEEFSPLFDELRRSYLSQFVYFAGQAYMENRQHPMAAYLQMLACLMKAHELALQGMNHEALALASAGYEAIGAIDDPTDKSHYMELQYHIKNANEFAEFHRLSSSYPKVQPRLDHLSFRAKRLKDDGKGRSPTMAFAFAPVLGWGARSASVAGLLISAAPLLGWDQSSIHASINALWVYAADQVPQLTDQASDLLASVAQVPDLVAHTGGVSGPLAHTGGIGSPLLAHTGGIANSVNMAAQLAELASHTGGFA